jgi:hypothetical protein
MLVPDGPPLRLFDMENVKKELTFEPDCCFRFHSELTRKLARDGASQEVLYSF